MAETHSLATEIQTLRNWPEQETDGTPIPGEAFGVGAYSRAEKWRFSPSLAAKDYVFSIGMENGELLLTIDTYTAKNGPAYFADEFDNEAWEAGMLLLSGSVSRQDFRVLHRIARALLGGRSVTFSDGEVIPAIQGVLA